MPDDRTRTAWADRYAALAEELRGDVPLLPRGFRVALRGVIKGLDSLSRGLRSGRAARRAGKGRVRGRSGVRGSKPINLTGRVCGRWKVRRWWATGRAAPLWLVECVECRLPHLVRGDLLRDGYPRKCPACEVFGPC